MPVVDDASTGFGRPVGAASAADRPTPASDKARASRNRDDFSMRGFLIGLITFPSLLRSRQSFSATWARSREIEIHRLNASCPDYRFAILS
jgi:hypothetical protein